MWLKAVISSHFILFSPLEVNSTAVVLKWGYVKALQGVRDIYLKSAFSKKY